MIFVKEVLNSMVVNTCRHGRLLSTQIQTWALSKLCRKSASNGKLWPKSRKSTLKTRQTETKSGTWTSSVHSTTRSSVSVTKWVHLLQKRGWYLLHSYLTGSKISSRTQRRNKPRWLQLRSSVRATTAVVWSRRGRATRFNLYSMQKERCNKAHHRKDRKPMTDLTKFKALKLSILVREIKVKAASKTNRQRTSLKNHFLLTSTLVRNSVKWYVADSPF